MRVMSAEQTVRMTQIDYDREMAFVAVNDAGETVGVSRLAREPGGESGEFAVIVQADMKGRGLASHLMRRLTDWGRAQGLKEMVGQVLADNAPMLAFVRHLGFTVHRMADDPEVMGARRCNPPFSTQIVTASCHRPAAADPTWMKLSPALDETVIARSEATWRSRRVTNGAFSC